MKKREFTKMLKELSFEGVLMAEKISILPSEKKNEIINFLVRNRQPIVHNFINNTTDINWLSSMGYLYNKKGKKFNFLCTSENQLSIKS